MNEGSSTARTADAPTDSRLELLLEQADEALAAGMAESLIVAGGVDGDLAAELAGAKECLTLLHRRFPRKPVQRCVLEPLGIDRDEEALPVPFGRFLVEEPLGQGGFGLVYRAFDPALSRDVALKVMRPEWLAGTKAHARFVREGQTAARLHHPYLVTVLEAGQVGPICYLASEYCPGPTLAHWLREREQPVAIGEAASIALRLSEGVGYMHERGVVHRDIKPGNVLLVEEIHDGETGRGRPDSLVPKLTDFGLAKSQEDDGGMTRTGAPLGTLAYMAPEQFGLQGREIGPRADVYSLGVVLYELLAGGNPFQGTTPAQTLQLASGDAPPLARMRRDVPRDLAAIVAKCLEREPARRYAHAGELADDLRRFAQGEAVRARPLGAMQRLTRWMRKNPGLAAAVGCCVLLAASIVGGAMWHSHRLGLLVADLQARQGDLLEQTYVNDFHTAQQAVEYEQFDEARERLDAYATPEPGIRDPRGTEWHALRQIVEPRTPLFTLPHESKIWCIDVSADGRLAATSESTGHIHLWDLATGGELRRWKAHEGEANAVRFVPGQPLLASTGQGNRLRMWEVPTGKLVLDLPAHDKVPYALRISPDGKYLATGSRDREVWLWELEKLVLATQSQSLQPQEKIVPKHTFTIGNRVYNVVFAPDGKRLVVATDIGFAVWDLESRQELFRGLNTRPARKLFNVPLSPSGRWLVAGGNGGVPETTQPPELMLDLSSTLYCREGLWVYDLEKKRIHDFLANDEWQFSMDQSPDGQWIASGGTGTVCLWKSIGLNCDQLMESKFAAHADNISVVRFTPDSRTLLTGSHDGIVKVWPLAGLAEFSRSRLLVHSSEVIEVAYSANGEELVAAGKDGTRVYLRERDGSFEVTSREIGPEARAIRFSQDLRSSVVVSPGRPRLSVWRWGDSDPLWKQTIKGSWRDVALSADGRVVATVAETSLNQALIQPYDALTGESEKELTFDGGPQCIIFQQQGRDIIIGGRTGLSILDIDSETVREVEHSALFDFTTVACSSDSRLVVAGSDTGTVLLVPCKEARVRWSQPVAGRPIRGLAFSPGDRLLAASSDDGTVTVIHCETCQVLAKYRLFPLIPGRLCFSPDGAELACAVSGEKFLGRSGIVILRLGE